MSARTKGRYEIGVQRSVFNGHWRRRDHSFLLCCLAWCTYLLLVVISSEAEAYEAFGGFQIDSEGQYLAYGAFRASLNRPTWPVEPFLQLFVIQQNFFFRSEGQLLQGQLSQVAPAVGLSKSIGGLTLQLSGGPAFRLNKEDIAVPQDDGRIVREKETVREIGGVVNGYASYTGESDMFEALLSYTNLSSFVFSRLRWTHYAFETEGGIPINPGLELLGTGNSQFKEGYAGALLSTELKKVELLLKGGYQNNSTFHSGAYGGIELYVKF